MRDWRVWASVCFCASLLVAVPAAAVDLTGGSKVKLADKDGTAKDMAAVSFVQDAAIADPLPDPTTQASRARISSEDGNAGWFDLDMGSWAPAGTAGYKYRNKEGAVLSVVLTTKAGKGGKMIVKLKGDLYGPAALAGPEDHVELRLEIGTTTYCGRFETGTSEVKRNEVGKVLMKGPSIACVTPVPKRVFRTSATYTGDLGGLGGADATCQARADAAALGGTWKAWLSTSAENARDRITDGHYTLVDGTIVANSLADLTNGGISHGIDRDENGAPLTSDHVWTGTLEDGTWYDSDCVAWTSASASATAVIGYASYSDKGWTDGHRTADCSYTGQRGVYCFEQ